MKEIISEYGPALIAIVAVLAVLAIVVALLGQNGTVAHLFEGLINNMSQKANIDDYTSTINSGAATPTH